MFREFSVHQLLLPHNIYTPRMIVILRRMKIIVGIDKFCRKTVPTNALYDTLYSAIEKYNCFLYQKSQISRVHKP